MDHSSCATAVCTPWASRPEPTRCTARPRGGHFVVEAPSPAQELSVDLLGALRALDRDLAWLGLLGARDAHGQHAGLVARLDAVGVERVAEEQLPGEHAERPLRDLHLHVLRS